MSWYIGIDPGVSGGIAAVSCVPGLQIDAMKMPATDRDLYVALKALIAENVQNGHPLAVLERVSSSPQMGVVSAFTFGRGVGALKMALAALEIPYDEVTPQKWQLVMGCRSRGDKNVTKRRAQQLFPALTITHATADALLMAEYCRRVHRGMNGHEGSADERRHTGAADAAGAVEPGQRGRRVPVSAVERGPAGGRERGARGARGGGKGNSPASA
jgi:Holliday junction resolvasome RuvABC endonuclease subunit